MWRRAGAVLFVALVAIFLLGTAASWTQDQSPSGLAPEEQRFCDLVNQERAKRGLSTLKVEPNLVSVARSHSREMAALDYFSHYSPTAGQRTPMDRYKAATRGQRLVSYLCVGENLYYGSLPEVDHGHDLLMASPKHKENILRSEYQYIGVGVYLSPDGQLWATQMFMCRR